LVQRFLRNLCRRYQKILPSPPCGPAPRGSGAPAAPPVVADWPAAKASGRRLAAFIDACPSPYHVVDHCRRRLEAEGFRRARSPSGNRWTPWVAIVARMVSVRVLGCGRLPPRGSTAKLLGLLGPATPQNTIRIFVPLSGPQTFTWPLVDLTAPERLRAVSPNPSASESLPRSSP